MAFDALDSLLRDQQFNLARQANFDLPFGGTTEAEFDFLSRNGAVNRLAPNFLSFLAGAQGANLATQQNRQLQFDRATQLRNQESNLALRGAQTRNALLTGDAAEARLPFVGDQAEANLNSTLLGNTNQEIVNKYLPAVTEARVNFQNEQTRGLGITNDNLPETIGSQNRVRNANAGNINARTAEQRFVNDNLQSREDLDRRERNAGIALRQAQTSNQQQLAAINVKKNNAFAEMNRLDIDLQKNQISRAQYDAQIAQKKSDAFDAIREEETLLNNAGIMQATASANASNALAVLRDKTDPNLRRGAKEPEYYVPPTVLGRPAPQAQPQTAVPGQNNNTLPAPVNLTSNPASQPPPDYTQIYLGAVGRNGITKGMVDLAVQGRMNGLAGNRITREELAAMMAVESALGLR